MSKFETSRPATMAELQAEIDRLHEGHARIYDENQRLRDEHASLSAQLIAFQTAWPGGVDEVSSVIRSLREDAEECDALRTKLADILTRTANALKGEPGPLMSHSWHDLSERAMNFRKDAERDAKDGYLNTNAHLEAKLALLEVATRSAEQNALLNSQKLVEVHAQLAESQARELRLREFVDLLAEFDETYPPQTVAANRAAELFLMPYDDSALCEMIEAAKAEERSEIEKLCEAYGTDKFSLYKGRPPYKGDEEGRASPYVDGQGDAAFDLACLISARGKA